MVKYKLINYVHVKKLMRFILEDLMDYADEREIDLLDLLFNVIRYWRVIILVAIVGAIGFGAYKYVKVKDTASSVETQIEKVEEIENSEGEIANYENAIEELEKGIARNEKDIEVMRNYKDESILMNIDPYNKPEAHLEYHIELEDKAYADELFRDPADTLVEAYALGAIGNADFTAVQEKYGIDQSYVKELITVTTNLDANNVCIKISGADQQMCSDIAKILHDSMATINKELGSKSAVHYLDLVINDYAIVVDQELATLQNQVETDIQQKLSDYTNGIATIKAYRSNIKTAEDSIEKTKEDGDVAVNVKKETTKFAIIGLLVGAFVACAVYGCMYMFKSVLRTSDDISVIYKYSIFGVFRRKTRKGRYCSLDKWIDKNLNKETTLSDEDILDRTTASVLSRINDTETVAIISSIKSDEVLGKIAGLSDKIPNLLSSSTYSVIGIAEDFSLADKCDYAIIVEKRGESVLDNIDKEIAELKLMKKEILGCLIV